MGLLVSLTTGIVSVLLAFLFRLADEARRHRDKVDEKFSQVLQETAYLRGLLERRDEPGGNVETPDAETGTNP